MTLPVNGGYGVRETSVEGDHHDPILPAITTREPRLEERERLPPAKHRRVHDLPVQATGCTREPLSGWSTKATFGPPSSTPLPASACCNPSR